MSLKLHKPCVLATINGDAVPVVNAGLQLSLYTRANTGWLQVPRGVLKGLDAYTPINLEMSYAHGGPPGVYKMYASDQPPTGDRLQIFDKWFELSSAKNELITTLSMVTFDTLLAQLLLPVGVTPVTVPFAWLKPKFHLWRESRKSAIERAEREFEIKPLMFFHRDEMFYCGVMPPPSPTVPNIEMGKHVVGRIEEGERRTEYDYQDIPEEYQSVGQRWDEANSERLIKYLRVPTVWMPWIWPGDVLVFVDVEYGGTYRVGACEHRVMPYGSTLELEEL